MTNQYEDDEVGYSNGAEGDDDHKVFLSRIPSTFDETSIQHIFEKYFGENCIENISLVRKRDEEGENKDMEEKEANQDYENSNKDKSASKRKDDSTEQEHRGFAFVTMTSVEKQQEAIKKGTIRGKAKEEKKRKHTLYIRPISRDDSFNTDSGAADDTTHANQESKDSQHAKGSNVCYLWNKFRCPYGDQCKFDHIGEGGCVSTDNEGKTKKKQKCHSFRKTGKCKLGEKCPYSHDFICKKVPTELSSESNKGDTTMKSSSTDTAPKDKKDKDCINWKTKGKCRKGDKCPYKHDEAVLQAFLLKKEKKDKRIIEEKKKMEKMNKVSQPLGVRVFGLNYDTTEKDVREYFEHCGKIREITFPTFEDSGRSKGYCGILFTSPYATEKACELDGQELHGRWLSVQPGKMYLRQWEEREESRKNKREDNDDSLDKGNTTGEFGQRVKKRKKHGFKDEDKSQ